LERFNLTTHESLLGFSSPALIAIWVGLVPIAKQHAVTMAKQVRHVMCHENVARLTIATTIVWPCVQGNMHPKGANVFADRPLLRLQDAGATPQAAMAMGTAPKLKGGVSVCASAPWKNVPLAMGVRRTDAASPIRAITARL
jgi:hypothetical protein